MKIAKYAINCEMRSDVQNHRAARYRRRDVGACHSDSQNQNCLGMVRGMKQVISIIIGALLCPFIAGLAVEVAKPYLSQLPAFMEWCVRLLEWAGFPWAAAGGLGLLAGLWLDTPLSRLDGRYPVTWAGKAGALADRVDYVALRCEQAFGLSAGGREHLNGLISEIIVLGAKLEKLGISGPYILPEESQMSLIRKMSAHFRALSPALREGDKAIAFKLDAQLRENQMKQKLNSGSCE